MSDPVIVEVPCDGSGPPIERPPTAEEAAQLQAIAEQTIATEAHTSAVKTFATSEDTERLALVNERAQTDPAFAALAELTLGGKGV